MSSPSIGRVLRGESANQRDPLLLIVLSLVVASVLTVYPLAYEVMVWRPHFMLLIMLFWVVYQPKWCGVWFAFSVGLTCDLMLDYQLGQHALSFVLIAFLLRLLTRNRRVLPFLMVWVFVVIGCFLHMLLMFILQKMLGQGVSLSHWLPWLSSVLAWPLVSLSLKRWRS
ncbi:MAG: rod shape-determining protein MreD [Pseudomonadota bacterium]|nr:rod shape-determining protein MreD [Pseudomonadota bacterium]